MKLSPLEIKQQQFEKSLRGYDVAEVQSFLSLVSNEVEHLLNKNKELDDQIQKLSDRVRHYERVEEALHETLQTTKESVAQKIETAKMEAQNKIDKAEMEADAIIKEANHQRQNVRQTILRLLDKREEIIGGIGSYLENARKSLEQFSKDDQKAYTLSDNNEVTDTPLETKVRSRFQLDTEESEVEEDDINLSFPPGSDRLDDILDEID
tara:strand:- start:1074 stop:1700 length:627 start_codon:yes stop_codon:yes gene_type:complete